MFDVLIISNYWHFPLEKSSSRYNTIASMVAEAGCNVEVVTSNFYHTSKKYRNPSELKLFKCPFKTKLIDEPSYLKNVSIKRIYSHIKFSRNVLHYLERREKPDVIYLFIPPTALAAKVVSFANKNDIRIIIDIQDLWPEAFEMLLPHFLAKLLLFPMKKSIEFAYANADKIVAVSQTYVQRALDVSKKCKEGTAVFIGTDIFAFDKFAKGALPLERKLRPITMVYIGMLGHSYDLIGVMDAMLTLRKSDYDNVEFLVMGDGPLRGRFTEYAERNQLPVRFTGRLSYEEMVKKLVKCDFAINILNTNAAQSVINKHADYVSAGIPIINIQKDTEFSNLLIEYNAGIACPLNDNDALAQAIKTLSEDAQKRKEMGENSRHLAEEKFDRNNTYAAIIELIEGKKQ